MKDKEHDMIAFATLNENGLGQIEAALEKYFRPEWRVGRLTHDMLTAWACSAEDSWLNGNGMCFEISSYYSASGHAEYITISGAGFDIEESN